MRRQYRNLGHLALAGMIGLLGACGAVEEDATERAAQQTASLWLKCLASSCPIYETWDIDQGWIPVRNSPATSSVPKGTMMGIVARKGTSLVVSWPMIERWGKVQVARYAAGTWAYVSQATPFDPPPASPYFMFSAYCNQAAGCPTYSGKTLVSSLPLYRTEPCGAKLGVMVVDENSKRYLLGTPIVTPDPATDWSMRVGYYADGWRPYASSSCTTPPPSPGPAVEPGKVCTPGGTASWFFATLNKTYTLHCLAYGNGYRWTIYRTDGEWCAGNESIYRCAGSLRCAMYTSTQGTCQAPTVTPPTIPCGSYSGPDCANNALHGGRCAWYSNIGFCLPRGVSPDLAGTCNGSTTCWGSCAYYSCVDRCLPRGNNFPKPGSTIWEVCGY